MHYWGRCLLNVFLCIAMTISTITLFSMGSRETFTVPPLDTQWIEVTNKKAAIKLEKLDIDLKNYKSNSIKESIR